MQSGPTGLSSALPRSLSDAISDSRNLGIDILGVLAKVELLGLLCNKFGLSDTRSSYTRLEILSYEDGD